MNQNVLKMSWLKLLIVYVLAAVPVIALFLVLVASGTVCVFYSGFAVDAEGLLYLGRDFDIRVYDADGVWVRTIDPQTNRGYGFTIKDDVIVLSTGSDVYALDLQGRVLGREEDVGTATYNALQRSRFQFVSESGDAYALRCAFGRSRIVRNGDETVYEMPALDYGAKLLMGAVFVSFWIVVPAIAFGGRKELSAAFGRAAWWRT